MQDGKPLTIAGINVYHTFLIFSDGKSTWAARAGPQFPPSMNIGFGNLKPDNLVLWENSADKPSETVKRQSVGALGMSFVNAFTMMDAFNADVLKAGIPYNPTTGFNSNSYTWALLRLLGLQEPQPSGLSPGYQFYEELLRAAQPGKWPNPVIPTLPLSLAANDQ